MAAQLSTKLTMDGTQHNNALRDAAKELSKYKREVDNTDKQLKQFKNQSRSATGAINTFAQSFKDGNIQGMMIGAKGATNALGLSLTKLGGVFGVAMGAAEVFTKSIHSSQIAEDGFGQVQAQVTTVVDNFFTSLTTGDFSPFLHGIDSMTEKARAAYQAMDDLWNMAQSFGVQNARLNNQFQKNLLEIRQLKGTKNPEEKKRLEELKRQNDEIIKKQAKGGLDLYNQTITSIQEDIRNGTGTNFTADESIIYRVLENDINNMREGRSKYKKEYQEYLKEVDALQEKYAAKYNKRQAGQGLINKLGHLNKEANYGQDYVKELTKLQEKHGEALTANLLLERYTDEQLESMNNKLKQGLAYENQSISNRSKMIRYDKETPTSGGSGGGKHTKKTTEENIGLIQKINKEIRDLNQLKERATSVEDIKKINTEIENLQWRLDLVKKGIDPDKLFQNLKKIEIPKMSLIPAIDIKNMKLPEIKIPSIAEQYEAEMQKVQNILKFYDMGIINMSKAQREIDLINEKLKALGLKPIDINLRLENYEKIRRQAQDITGAFGSIDGVVNSYKSLKQSIDEGADAWEQFMGVVSIVDSTLQAVGSTMQAVETIQKLLGITTKATSTIQQTAAAQDSANTAIQVSNSIAKTTASSGEAVAGATASGAKLPFPFNLAAIAAGIAAVVGALAMIGSFADGGIIGGKTTIGDYNLARVNKGEMILNTRQQTHLFNMINNGTSNSNGTYVYDVRVKGSDLYLAMKNYGKEQKGIGKNIGLH